MYPTDPPDAREAQHGYTGYHNDGVFDRGDAWRGEQGQPIEAESAAQSVMRRERRHLVVILTLFDLRADGGASSVVGGSPHLNRNPPPRPLTAADGAVCAAGPAGSAIVFDTRCWHAAAANTSGEDRRTLTIRYIPFHLKPLGASVNNASVLDARGWLDTPLRRQLMGLELET